MPLFTVYVTETLRKLMLVEASSAEEALDRVQQQYVDEEIILSADDFDEVCFEVTED